MRSFSSATMKWETRLDSAVFQLTPTRTRCDLVILANGNSEKIVSGLVEPFLSHLKTAQDQIAIGGYSIKLEPVPGTEAAWFTKGTVNRFIRFVNTPAVLERVNTIESEILQIVKAISIQGNGNLSLSTGEEHHQMKSTGSTEGNKPTFDADVEKAIILYKPGSIPNPPESNGSKLHEENSKVQLLRVLESRKKVLQKEQAMAFARTAAAGFDVENMTHLISFAESFGAFRLMEACTLYIQLWKGKHETGQWIEVEAADALSFRSEFSSLNTSGIILSGDAVRQKELLEMSPVSGIESVEHNGNATVQDNDRDKIFPSEPQAPRGLHEYYQGQFQYPAFPPWPMLSHPGLHGFQPYPMQGVPYYQKCPMNGQFFHHPLTPMEDPKADTPKRKMKMKHSMNSRESTLSEEGSDENMVVSEEESSKGQNSHMKAVNSKQKKGVVVIQNLNYIARNRHEIPENGSESSSETEIEENKESLPKIGGKEHKSLKPSKVTDNNSNQIKSLDISNVHRNDEEVYSQESDAGNWQAFQSFLLRAEEKMTSMVNEEILSHEKEPHARKGQNKSSPDPVILPERDSSSYQNEGITEYSICEKRSRTNQFVPADEILVSNVGIGMQDSHIATHFKENEGGVRGYRKVMGDAFIIHGEEKQTGSEISSDPLVYCEHEHGGNSEKSLHSVNDDSFVVPVRSGSQDLLGADRRLTIDMDSEFSSVPQRNDDSSNKETTGVIYEPDDLTMMLERTRENESVGYGPAIGYDFQATLVVKHESEKEEYISTSTNKKLMKTLEEKQLNLSQGGLEKKGKDVMKMKLISSRSIHLTEAQKRAEKLRNYKAGLQKLKKEQEEKEMKRLEALKRERQKRIATRSGSNSAQSPATPQQHKTRLVVKGTPGPYKSSKFSDSEPGSNSPLQRLSRNITSIGSNNSDRVPKTVRSNIFSISTSSLPELKKEGMKIEVSSASERIRRLSEPKGKGVRQEGSSASDRIRVLSEPKGSILCNVPEKSSKNAIQLMKRPLPEEPQSKKISAIIQLDRTKSETLPELKLNTTYRTPLETVKNKPATKQQKGSGSRSSLISEKMVEKIPSFSYSDENPEVEKIVVIENEVVSSSSPVQASEGNTDSVDKSYRDVRTIMTGVDTVYTASRAPPSLLYGVEVQNPSDDQDVRVNSYEVVNYLPKDETERLLDPAIPKKPYQAPYARATSLEDPTAGNFQYAELQPVLNTGRTMTEIQTTKVDVHNVADMSLVDRLDEIQEKARNKESKGLKKLWKFGRKGHSSGSAYINSDLNGSVVDNMMATSSSRDISAPFSILSPFRGRNKEKKVVA